MTSIHTQSGINAFTARLEELSRERESHLMRVSEIDEIFAKAARQLGLDASALAGARLPLPPKASDGERRGLGGSVLKILLHADRGLSLKELRTDLEKIPEIKEQLTRNPNHLYTTTSRYAQKGWIVQIDSLFYHPDRAPLPDGQDDPTGYHLPGVVSLFGNKSDRRIDVGD